MRGGWLQVERDVALTEGRVDHQAGTLRIGGTLLLGGAAGAHADYLLRGGELVVPSVTRRGNARLHFEGGTLRTSRVGFDLVNEGGRLFAAGKLQVSGNFENRRGTLVVGNGASVVVGGDAILGGELQITGDEYCDGRAFVVLTASRRLRGHFERIPRGFEVFVKDNRVLARYVGREHLSAASGRARSAG